jgi:hypothetical protein
MGSFGWNLRSLIGGLALSSALLVPATKSDAAMVLLVQNVTQGLTSIVVDDFDGPIGTVTGLGLSNKLDNRAGDGQVGLVAAIGNFTLTVTTGVSKPILTNGAMDVHMAVRSTGTGGTLRVILTDTDFVSAAGLTLISGHIGGTTEGSVSYRFGVDLANVEGAFTQSSGPQGPLTGTNFDGDTTLPITLDSLFSLSQEVTIVHGSGTKRTGLDFFLAANIIPGGGDPIPEPAAFGGLMLMAMLFARRPRNQA